MTRRILTTACVALAVTAGMAQAELVGHWTFDTDGAAAVGPDTTLGINASIDTVDTQVGDGSLSLTGVGDDNSSAQTAANYADITGGGARTVAMWVKLGTQIDPNAALVSWGSTAGGGQRWDVRLDDAKLRTEVQAGFIVGTTSLGDGEWHHVAVTLKNDGSPNVDEVMLYVDGFAESISTSGAQAVNTGSANPLIIGNSILSASDRNFVGNIDDVRIYNNALSAIKVYALSHTTKDFAAANASLNFDAELDTPGDNTWTDLADVDPAFDIEFLSSTNTPVNKSPAMYDGRVAYDLDGTQKATFTNGANGVALQSGFAGDPTNGAVSFELVFNADTLTGRQVLMDFGGNGTGTSLTLDGSTLQLHVKNGGSLAVAEIDLSTVNLGVDDWLHATATIDLAGDLVTLYLNGQQVDTAVFAPGDWAGDDGGAGLPGGGLGDVAGVNGTIAANFDPLLYGGFDGQLAVFRMYESVLSADQAKFLASVVIPTPGALSGGLLALGLVAMRRRK
ncbi:LamG domain-containing protein [Planctomycetales bacterium ZRK34]|nr:LamG domain-containing protein [Planctomycetales bacterium ZRK34]